MHLEYSHKYTYIICLFFFGNICMYISQEFNSPSRSSRVLCAFFTLRLFIYFRFLFFLILMLFYVPATFTVALCWFFFFYFVLLFFLLLWYNNAFFVTTSHRYLHIDSHMECRVNRLRKVAIHERNSPAIFFLASLSRFPMSFRRTFAYIIAYYMHTYIYDVLFVCVCVFKIY